MQSYIILLFSIITAVTGQFLIKKGMMSLGPQEFNAGVIISLVKYIFTNGFIFFGLAFYGISFLAWMMVLSKMKLSVAYPATSLMYVFVILGSFLIFKETITVFQLIGIALILAGIFFIFYQF
ncbi:transporter [Candidatus Parcubacteria bacterium]|nr:MAG: transporter [Candidatus Parcubacteria bacterium]